MPLIQHQAFHALPPPNPLPPPNNHHLHVVTAAIRNFLIRVQHMLLLLSPRMRPLLLL
jgi:hypothetical protein